jgi:SAM-dependent methyltransferase
MCSKAAFNARPIALERAGFDAVSADVSPGQCRRPCLAMDMNSPFADGFSELFDAICCFEVLEHIESPRMALRECKKLLKPGGMLFVSTPDASGVYSRIRFMLKVEFAMFSDLQYKTIGHITPISYWQIGKMFKENKLEIVDQLDYDGSATVPRTLGDVVKLASKALRTVLPGRVGLQTMVFACRAL